MCMCVCAQRKGRVGRLTTDNAHIFFVAHGEVERPKHQPRGARRNHVDEEGAKALPLVRLSGMLHLANLLKEIIITCLRFLHTFRSAGPSFLVLTFVEDGLRIFFRWDEQHHYMTRRMGMGSACRYDTMGDIRRASHDYTCKRRISLRPHYITMP